MIKYSVILNFLIIVIIVNSAPPINSTLGPTRRILKGREVGDTRPYMVYMRPANAADPKLAATNWLCGGVIIHERYVLTSAACIEDAKHFYVVSGTHRWIAPNEKEDACITNGAKKAVWKCVPKSYYFDGDEFDNIRWMLGDIAVVKVEDNFNFERRIKGCDFVPQKVAFNNHTEDLEKSGGIGSIAGWGTTDSFGDVIGRSTLNSPQLLETDVQIISKKNCKKRWDPRYHFVINGHVICTKDGTDDEQMSKLCTAHEIDCKALMYSEEYAESGSKEQTYRRMVVDSDNLVVHTAAHYDDTRRHKIFSGGFCENDHGGPLVVGQGKSSVVVGIMSACQTRQVTHKCYGPFLFTSVYNYRSLIACAVDKDLEPTCRKLLRSSKGQVTETILDWNGLEERQPKRTQVPVTHHRGFRNMDRILRTDNVTHRMRNRHRFRHL